MIGRSADWLSALAAGALLAVMIACNGLLAKHSAPVFASWAAHGTGAAAALLLVAGWSRIFKRQEAGTQKKGPAWAYLGGVPGALTVVLAAITTNSPLALSGTIAFMLVGQVIFGMAMDCFGLFGVAKRPFAATDVAVVALVLSGSVLLTFGGR
ncbi:DMT family transporter [Aminobacter anthyllidis]|uniref:DMT family transporter n=1 Tax=Aminobacter anthyllidis TaxID=1035067 RepID=A0A9X1AFI4_9HYPH|nr:DMT family transporter [Aminobacter anthyllidis]MBT1159024.1 DMT family transporter [Aminobacter anthyllidis]